MNRSHECVQVVAAHDTVRDRWETAASTIGASMALSRHGAFRLVTTAVALIERLLRTTALLTAGWIGFLAARTIAGETVLVADNLMPELDRLISERLAPTRRRTHPPRLGPLRKMLTKTVTACDPIGADARAQQARRDQDVEMVPLRDDRALTGEPHSQRTTPHRPRRAHRRPPRDHPRLRRRHPRTPWRDPGRISTGYQSSPATPPTSWTGTPLQNRRSGGARRPALRRGPALHPLRGTRPLLSRTRRHLRLPRLPDPRPKPATSTTSAPSTTSVPTRADAPPATTSGPSRATQHRNTPTPVGANRTPPKLAEPAVAAAATDAGHPTSGTGTGARPTARTNEHRHRHRPSGRHEPLRRTKPQRTRTSRTNRRSRVRPGGRQRPAID